MNKFIQEKLEEYMRIAKASTPRPITTTELPAMFRNDSLSSVIRSKEDAERFMAELDMISKLSK
ncbi:hypothetical protein [Pedobacter hartonius]|uniref:Uncharacterized protein n=1 Tax=Pedobacter hartonius TaxID=425514 RepID=A0A1H4DTB3_9SPHI|nr:hypothetical protein [Pedobacter hartonius]SEA75877.1 hypothetical protein SAMN05443550_10593 [Pedobacter hartonius]